MHIPHKPALHLLLLVTILLCNFACKDDETPNNVQNPNRYKLEVFTDLTVTKDIKYGQNTTESGVTKDLLLDFYEPTGDTETQRPLLITLIGGGFIQANRADFDQLARFFARRGYAVANMTYTIYDGTSYPLDSLTTYKSLVRARADLKAAIRLFRKDAATENKYKINSNKIFALGHSAGSFTTLAAAYISDLSELNPLAQSVMTSLGGLEGNSGNAGYSSTLQGIVNMAGAIVDINAMDSNEAPVISLHGTNDIVVPYCAGVVTIPGFISPVRAQGSCKIDEKAAALGIKHKLVTINGGDHSSPLNPAVCPSCGQDIADFLHSLL